MVKAMYVVKAIKNLTLKIQVQGHDQGQNWWLQLEA